MANRASAPPAVNATVSGAVSGIIVFVILVLMDRFFLSGRTVGRYSLVTSLVGAGIFGAVFGAAVGFVVALTRSMVAGIATGAVLFAALKVAGIGAASTGLTAFAIIMGLIDGALFGFAVASSAAKALESGR